jgi:hypothetical protein
MARCSRRSLLQLAVNFEYWPTYDQCSKVMGTALGQIYGKTPGSASSAMTNATQQRFR